MSVHGRKDFILLQLNEGMLELKVDNGKGIIVAQVNMSNPYQICDGEWHTIESKFVFCFYIRQFSSTRVGGTNQRHRERNRISSHLSQQY